MEVPGWDVLESGTVFEVADREFDDGVLTMELVDIDGGAVEVGEEPEVAPVGPQLQLVLVGQTCAAHDQPASHLLFADAGGVVAFGDFGYASSGIAAIALLMPLMLVLTAIV